MGKLFKNMLPYWKSVIAVFCLLVVQACCDLALPQYTSNIIDVGIMNGGEEHILPEKITEESYRMIMLMMTDEEKEAWEESFEKEGSLYVAKDLSEEELEVLDQQLMIPAVLAYQMQNNEEIDIDQVMQAAGTSGTGAGGTDGCHAGSGQGFRGVYG